MRDLAALGRSCLIETYLGLATALPGVQVKRTEEWVLCTGPTDAKFANFAAGFRLESVEDLSYLVAEALLHLDGSGVCPVSFMVCGGDKPDDLAGRLFELGFTGRSELAHLVWEPAWRRPLPASPLPMVEAIRERERKKAAVFMTRQFFPNRSGPTHQMMEMATARSPHRLFAAHDRLGRITAACMITAASGCFGLYNVCVRADLRGRGLGARLVSSALEMAVQDNRPLFLQSAPDLASWYEGLGMERLGLVVNCHREASPII